MSCRLHCGDEQIKKKKNCWSFIMLKVRVSQSSQNGVAVISEEEGVGLGSLRVLFTFIPDLRSIRTTMLGANIDFNENKIHNCVCGPTPEGPLALIAC